MARKAMRSAKPVMWMTAGALVTLVVVWGPHKTIDRIYDAGRWVGSSASSVFA